MKGHGQNKPKTRADEEIPITDLVPAIVKKAIVSDAMAEYVAEWINQEVNPHEVEAALDGVAEALEDPAFWKEYEAQG